VFIFRRSIVATLAALTVPVIFVVLDALLGLGTP
jgi:hypothetical protein